MLARTAANLYWMSRYLERAENLARVLKLDAPGMSNKVAIAWNGAPHPAPVDAALAALPWAARGQLRAGFRRLSQAWARSTPH